MCKIFMSKSQHDLLCSCYSNFKNTFSMQIFCNFQQFKIAKHNEAITTAILSQGYDVYNSDFLNILLKPSLGSENS